MASRSLDDLSLPVKKAAINFQAACLRAGFNVLIYCTLRPASEQAALYAVGRTKPGVRLTNAKPGESLHQPDASGLAWAFDAVPMRHGRCLWTDDKTIDAMGAAGESVGLDWAGRWTGAMREKLHFQIKDKV